MSGAGKMDLPRIARSVEEADPSAIPVLVHARRVDAFEVDFQALSFVVEEPLPAVDRAVLGLTLALGRLGPHDVRCYLGLGHVVSELMLLRLSREGLLLDQSAGDEDAEAVEAEAVERLPTSARTIERLPPDVAHTYVLTDMGREALARDARRMFRLRSCRLILWAEPLHFIGVAREPARMKKRSAPARSKPLSPELVPKSLVSIDDLMALNASEREQLSGLGEKLPGVEGRLLGCAPDSQWEVRVADKEPNSLLVFAGYPVPEGLEWRVFVGSPWSLSACPRWLLMASHAPEELLAPEFVDEAVDGLGLERAWDVKVGGQEAVPVLAEGAELLRMLGDTDRPMDSWAPLQGTRGGGWASAVRVRALPGSPASAHRALLEFVCRREVALLHDLEAVVGATWEKLGRYWGGRDFPTPSREWLLLELWSRQAMRGVVCQARLRHDLVDPYTGTGEAA
ncbi:hypothetical protein [Archangium sp.]|uniref:hypothetical protein n=1 Tax=Archangium sp. TaxID=1872627 RepID=UPI00286C0CAC|nr:hypothetical protein [Archangium sp.]